MESQYGMIVWFQSDSLFQNEFVVLEHEEYIGKN